MKQLAGMILGGLMVTDAAGGLLHGQTDPFDFEDFRALGFATSPAAGQLDSNLFRAVGLSAGEGQFGGRHESGDFARGAAGAAVSTGGIYAFDLNYGRPDLAGSSDWALGWQPTSSDLNPGGIELMLRNDHAHRIESLRAGFELAVRNNGDRAGAISFYRGSSDRGAPVQVELLEVQSPAARDPDATWMKQFYAVDLMDLGLEVGQTLTLGWAHRDLAGRGARDEFAIDSLSFQPIGSDDPSGSTLPVVTVAEPRLAGLLALVGCGMVLWSRRRGRGNHSRGQRDEDWPADTDGATRCRGRQLRLRQSRHDGAAPDRRAGRFPPHQLHPGAA